MAVCLLCPVMLWADTTYRWVDDEGNVHYGTTLPPEYADRPHQIINEAGIVIKRVDDPVAAQQPAKKSEKEEREPLFTEDEVRLRSDRLLVLKYHSEDEILEAMEVEIANLDYDERLINQGQASLVKSMYAQVREAADRQRAGLPVEPETEQEIRKMRVRLKRGAESRASLLAREEQIRAAFQAELERYRYLQGGGQPGTLPEGE